jgi:ubiquinone/menaquinone biosynthesis C-methylase UbiE
MSFDNASENYLNSSDHTVGEDLELLRSYFPDSFESLLDIATAAGHCANTIDAYNKIGIDLSHNMLKTARDNSKVNEVCMADGSFLPFKDDSFDITTCRIAFHHFRKPQEFFTEVRRVTDGIFVLIDSIIDIDDAYLNSIEYIRDNSHFRSYTVNEILDFAQNKFRLLSYTCLFKEHNFSEWAKRLKPDHETYTKIENAFVNLPKTMKNELKVVENNNKIESYIDKKGLFIFCTI